MSDCKAKREGMMLEGRFITILTPSKAEGVGRALQLAFGNGFDLPADFRACLDRLDRVQV